MLLYFIRHGQTDWNKDMRMQGQSDIPLNENGRESAIKAGKTLASTHIDLAFSSPLKRAKETAELVLAGRDIPIIEDKRIEEICFGICEGMRGRDENGQPVGCFAEFFAHPEQYQAPENGEDAKMLCARTWNFLEDITTREELQDKSILIATHGAALQSMMLWVNKQPICDFWKSGLKKNCSVTKVEVKDGQIKVLEDGEKQYNV